MDWPSLQVVSLPKSEMLGMGSNIHGTSSINVKMNVCMDGKEWMKGYKKERKSGRKKYIRTKEWGKKIKRKYLRKVEREI